MNDTTNPPFNWQIDEGNLWPPQGRPTAPFGPTAIEIMRSCALRVCFEASKRYERRTAYAARVGIAFHRTLQSLTEHPIASTDKNIIIEEAYRRFRNELASQEAQKNSRPREQTLTRNEERVHHALESVATEALRLPKQLSAGKMEHKRKGATPISSTTTRPPETGGLSEGEIIAEVPVQSQDGLLAGRIDYAERLPEGVRLLDYKSALRDDLPERYERQLQIYALLWYETFGEWPAEASVVYPFTGSMYKVSVDPETCQRIGDEARMFIQKVYGGFTAEQLASPGDVCAVCEFRPWCKPFWIWQTRHSNHSLALQHAVLGFEGEIVTLELKNFYWKVIVKWRDSEVRIVAPQERFPQLMRAHPGMRIRALDMRLHGQRYRPLALVTESSEIFLVQLGGNNPGD